MHYESLFRTIFRIYCDSYKLLFFPTFMHFSPKYLNFENDFESILPKYCNEIVILDKKLTIPLQKKKKKQTSNQYTFCNFKKATTKIDVKYNS